MTDLASSPDWQQFLARIRQMPECDVVRLVAADWLDDHGHGERAEFVRVQCRISEIRSDCSCGSCVRLRGGGQHTNGPCDVSRERIEMPDGSSRNAMLRARNVALCESIYGPLFGPLALAGGTWEIDRGFVSTVRAPLASLHGGECGRCRGERVIYDPADFRRTVASRCPACDGTGRTIGVLGRLLAVEPVGCEGIEVVDREPSRPQVGGRFMWVIDELEIGRPSCRIPADLFTVMEELAGELGANVLEFDTADEANRLLGAALFRLHAPRLSEAK